MVPSERVAEQKHEGIEHLAILLCIPWVIHSDYGIESNHII